MFQTYLNLSSFYLYEHHSIRYRLKNRLRKTRSNINLSISNTCASLTLLNLGDLISDHYVFLYYEYILPHLLLQDIDQPLTRELELSIGQSYLISQLSLPRSVNRNMKLEETGVTFTFRHDGPSFWALGPITLLRTTIKN